MEFKVLKKAIQEQMNKMSKGNLFTVNVNKDYMWEFYLDSFPEGTNNIYKERREYDCNCCKQFIRRAGHVVSIVDNELVSIWDVKVEGYYQEVCDKMSKMIKLATIKDIFLNDSKHLGVDYNHQLLEDGSTQKWNHFYFKLPNKFVKSNDSIGSLLSSARSTKDVFKRSIEEITIESAEIVLELIDQNSLYRGKEHKAIVESFLKYKKQYNDLNESVRDNWTWETSYKLGNAAARIRNTVIGTLLVDISDGKSLDEAVRMFESKVAPENYKRPSAVVTKSMIQNAQKKVQELGIESSLSRRYATIEDITINNILFANRAAKNSLQGDIFDELLGEVSDTPKNFDKVEEVSIDKFIKSILPKSESVELLVENKHHNNFMSLVAPVNPDSPNILKWDNNFSWSYNGEVTDSMKERVKKAGGKVDGVLRFSIEWNHEGNNNIDFDAHCQEPTGYIRFDTFKKPRISPGSGQLDVDIISPGKKIAVENIIWGDERRMKDGTYKFFVHNYDGRRSKGGFKAEIEYKGQVYEYSYNKNLNGNQKVEVATVQIKNGEMKIKHKISHSQTPKEVWGINTTKNSPEGSTMSSLRKISENIERCLKFLDLR